MRNLCITLITLFVSASGFSQPVCGFDVVHKTKLRYDRSYRRAVEQNEVSVQKYISRNRSRLSARTTGLNSVLYTIPVVVHVMHTGTAIGSLYNPTDAQIISAIDYLNQVYNGSYPGTQGIGDLQVQFQLASIDPDCNATTAIERIDASGLPDYAANGVSTDPGITPGTNELNVKQLSRWNPFRYYNIWVVNKIDGKDGTSGTYTGGYAYFPGALPEYDGTVILATQLSSGNKTLPHEIGHAFGLYHVFEGSSDKNSCPTNSDCNVNGDRVCDTDPVSYNALGGTYDFTCRTGVNPCTGNMYNSNTESNYMNYTNCYTLFTAGQKARILANAAGSFRQGLASSLALETTYPMDGYVPPLLSACTPASGPNALSQAYAGILNIGVNDRNLSSSTANVDNGYLDGTQSCINLVALKQDEMNIVTVQLAGINQEQVRGWIDYNNDGVFDDATEQLFYESSVSTSSPNVSLSFSVPPNAPLNTVMRMRVIDDVSTLYGVSSINSACFNSAYGQAEDYPVYITAGLLPVTLLNFRGVITNQAARLSWTTSDEINLQDFEVQKSVNGTEFLTIGTLAAKGEPGVLHDYSFTDPNLAEQNYYRLRMNDMDGSTKVSSVVLLRHKAAATPLVVVKNPFSNYIELRCGEPGQKVHLQLINTLGALVAHYEFTSSVGTQRWTLPGNLSKGHYVLKAVTGGQLFTTKLVKQ